MLKRHYAVRSDRNISPLVKLITHNWCHFTQANSVQALIVDTLLQDGMLLPDASSDDDVFGQSLTMAPTEEECTRRFHLWDGTCSQGNRIGTDLCWLLVCVRRYGYRGAKQVEWAGCVLTIVRFLHWRVRTLVISSLTDLRDYIRYQIVFWAAPGQIIRFWSIRILAHNRGNKCWRLKWSLNDLELQGLILTHPSFSYGTEICVSMSLQQTSSKYMELRCSYLRYRCHPRIWCRVAVLQQWITCGLGAWDIKLLLYSCTGFSDDTPHISRYGLHLRDRIIPKNIFTVDILKRICYWSLSAYLTRALLFGRSCKNSIMRHTVLLTVTTVLYKHWFCN